MSQWKSWRKSSLARVFLVLSAATMLIAGCGVGANEAIDVQPPEGRVNGVLAGDLSMQSQFEPYQYLPFRLGQPEVAWSDFLAQLASGRMSRLWEIFPGTLQTDLDRVLGLLVDAVEPETWTELATMAEILDEVTQQDSEALEELALLVPLAVEDFGLSRQEAVYQMLRAMRRVATHIVDAPDPNIGRGQALLTHGIGGSLVEDSRNDPAGPIARLFQRLQAATVERVSQDMVQAVIRIDLPEASVDHELAVSFVETRWFPARLLERWSTWVQILEDHAHWLASEDGRTWQSALRSRLVQARGQIFSQFRTGGRVAPGIAKELFVGLFPPVEQVSVFATRLGIVPAGKVKLRLDREWSQEDLVELLPELEQLTDRPDEAVYTVVVNQGSEETSVTLGPLAKAADFPERLAAWQGRGGRLKLESSDAESRRFGLTDSSVGIETSNN
jgi:hypothetical protein